MANDPATPPPPVNKTIEELRRVFTPMTSRLTLEIEPAVVYDLRRLTTDSGKK